jgi:hypothetical protein
MGYRSDVTIALYAKKESDAPAIKLWIKENFPVKEFENCITWFDKGMLVRLESVKWYPDYDDVRACEEAYDEFVELFCCDDLVTEVDEQGGVVGCAEFIRVGEEYDDVDVKRDGYYCDYILDMRRSITVEGL